MIRNMSDFQHLINESQTRKEKEMGEKTTMDLRETLLGEIETLRSGHSTPQRAQAVAKLAHQALLSVKVDIECHNFSNKSKGGLAPKPANLLK